ncbi:hypothetical protein HanIR_Chr17g0856691 [Helianthus annuus]|nr:hypothetical protein HanIR_Chr17g0856691 [Helianthus annuus]
MNPQDRYNKKPSWVRAVYFSEQSRANINLGFFLVVLYVFFIQVSNNKLTS